MIFDLLTPPKGPSRRGQQFFAVARPIHVSYSHTKFGWISSNGVGDSITDGRKRLQYPLHFLKKAWGKLLMTHGKHQLIITAQV